MEISSVDFSEPDELYEPEKQPWENVGMVAFAIFSGIAACAAGPALVKKKRIYSLNLTHDQVQQIIELPEGDDEVLPDLPAPRCNESERKAVEEIFQTIAEGGVNLGFPWVVARLIKLGYDIDHIHPYSFLLAAPKHHVRSIFLGGLGLKINGVMKGVVKGMEREFAKNNLNHFTASFAQQMNKNSDRIKEIVASRNWRGLVEYLYLG